MDGRRSFLKKSGLVIIGLAAASFATPAKKAVASTGKLAMLIDLDRCIGCQSCVIACKSQNITTRGFFNTRIEIIETGVFPHARASFIPRLCNQCEDPPCVEACPEKATFKLNNGIVVTDWARCTGVGACVEACPYDARFLDPESGNKADKCDFCIARLEKGLEPACVDACPSQARIFGDLANPQGEFAQYLQNKALIPYRHGIDTFKVKVLYTVPAKP